jgi:hypothetical protein
MGMERGKFCFIMNLPGGKNNNFSGARDSFDLHKLPLSKTKAECMPAHTQLTPVR